MQHKLLQQPSFHPTLCLIMGEQNSVEWKNSQSKNIGSEKGNGHQKFMKSMTSNGPTGDPWINREVKTLSSLESNCESETSEDEMKADETPMQPQLEMDDDYITFCNKLTKSPDRDAASSRLFCASVFSGSFSFAIASDDEDDVTDDDDDVGDDDEGENKGSYRDDRPEPSDHDFDCLKFSNGRCFSSSSARFDPLAMSGLFLPALLSPEIFDVPPSLIFGAGSFCSLGGSDDNEEEEFADHERLKEVNERWQQEYESSVIPVNMPSGNCADRASTRKLVHFATEETFISIPNRIEWANDYESARKGPWEQYYRDHLRFAKRIESANHLLSQVLDSNHRTKVFRDLYEGADDGFELVTVPDESTSSNRAPANIS